MSADKSPQYGGRRLTIDREPARDDDGVRAVDGAPVRELFPGIRLRPLWAGEVAKAYVLQMDPGSCWEGIDVHDPGPEEVFVVDGVFNDGSRDYPAGSFIHAPAGSSHIPQSAQGCTLFLFYPEG